MPCRASSLYEETRLVVREGNEWQMWGDANEDGSSRGPIPHSAVVAAILYVLGKRMQLRKTRALTVSGLVHDAFKRREMERGGYEATHAVSRKRLTELFGSEVADFAELSGHAAMPAALASLGKWTTALAFLADNMVVGTRIVSASEKCNMLDRAASTGRYPYNEEGRQLYGVPFFTFQRALSVVLEARVALRLGIKPTAGLAEAVRGWITEDFNVQIDGGGVR